MGVLSKPSIDLAQKIVTEVGFNDRIIGYKLRERTGSMRKSLYSFREVVALLFDHHPRIDLDVLEKWIRRVFSDVELANNLKSIISEALSDKDKTLEIRELMKERLLQCLVRVYEL